MSDPAKGIGRNILSVVAGVFIALFIALPIGFLAALLGFSDATLPRSQEIFSDIVLITGMVCGCIMGGYMTVKISTRKDIIHGLITGIVLTFLLAWVNDFEFNLKYLDIGLSYFCVIPVVLLGAFLGARRKKAEARSAINSLPPNSPG